MSELVIEAGVTVKLPGKNSFNMAKPTIRFTIDSAGDVDAQIAQHQAALEKVAPAIENALAQELANLTGLTVEGGGDGAVVTELKELMGFTIKEQKRVGKLLKKAGIDRGEEEKPKKRGRPKKKKEEVEI